MQKKYEIYIPYPDILKNRSRKPGPDCMILTAQITNQIVSFSSQFVYSEYDRGMKTINREKNQ
jgi:hypothetical protein